MDSHDAAQAWRLALRLKELCERIGFAHDIADHEPIDDGDLESLKRHSHEAALVLSRYAGMPVESEWLAVLEYAGLPQGGQTVYQW